MILLQKPKATDMVFKSLAEKYVTAKRKRAALEKKLAACNVPTWMDALVRPLAQALLLHHGIGWATDISGPFGLGSHVEIRLWKTRQKTEWVMELCPGDLDKGELYVLHPEKPSTTHFEPNTIGSANRLGMAKTLLPKNITVFQLWELMRRRPRDS